MVNLMILELAQLFFNHKWSVFKKHGFHRDIKIRILKLTFMLMVMNYNLLAEGEEKG